MSQKIRVGVVFGGRSGEHEVSLRSARSVMDNLDQTRYDILPIGITKAGRWLAGDDSWQQLASGEADGGPTATLIGAPGDPTLKAIEADGLRTIGTLDVIFPVLHGTYGEDGTIQGLFELADIPYVGADVLGSAVGMDKVVFKAVMQANDIPILPYAFVRRSEWEADPDPLLNHLEVGFTYPMFVKPANLGSSVGVSRATDRASLRAALNEAARYDARMVVEQGIDAREIEVSVLGNEDPIASVPGEIVPADAFYSYAEKYLNDTAALHIPADLPDSITSLVRELAVRAFVAIGGSGLARVDFLLDRADGTVWMNEVNTMPGFTSISMYPKLWEATGVPYPDLLDKLIQLAMDRHADKARNVTSYEVDEA